MMFRKVIYQTSIVEVEVICLMMLIWDQLVQAIQNSIFATND